MGAMAQFHMHSTGQAAYVWHRDTCNQQTARSNMLQAAELLTSWLRHQHRLTAIWCDAICIAGPATAAAVWPHQKNLSACGWNPIIQ
jgi:hypothetical protein